MGGSSIPAFLVATESCSPSNKLSPCVQLEHDKCHALAVCGIISPAPEAYGKGRVREVPGHSALFEFVVILNGTAA